MSLKIGKREFTNEQLVFIAIAGALVVLVLLVLVGIVPGRRGGGAPRVDLVVWGSGDSESTWRGTIGRFRSAYPNVSIDYVSVDAEDYEEELINALAAGRGPDAFMFSSKWALEHRDKIIPAPSDKISPSTFSGLFPQVAEEDFIKDGRIYALPLSSDTLVLAYNRDLFDRSGVVFPPETWDDLQEATLLLRRFEAGELSDAAFAIGGTSESVGNSSDILSLIILQMGSEIIDEERNRVDLRTATARDALTLYTQFADPESPVYGWSESFGNSNNAFVNERVAAIFAYPDDIKEIQEANPFLDFEVSEMPQLDPNNPINIGSYWGIAVSATTPRYDAAWDFAIFAATDRASAEDYVAKTGRPPALRFLIDNYSNNPDFSVFLGQALTAKSWHQPDEQAVDEIFDGMISGVLSEETDSRDAVRQGLSEISKLLRER